jgi:TonB family protein
VIVIEFAIFVISSGLFYSERFRHHLWAVIIAGAVATGSSLLFFWDVYEKMQARPEAPVKVRVVKVNVPVIQHVSRPPQLSKPETCKDDYPFFARLFNQEGTTELAFTVLADGTVSGVKVSKSSNSDRLDNAAVECVSKWHYRPAIKDDQTIDTPMTVKVDWKLKDGSSDGEKPADDPKQ